MQLKVIITNIIITYNYNQRLSLIWWHIMPFWAQPITNRKMSHSKKSFAFSVEENEIQTHGYNKMHPERYDILLNSDEVVGIRLMPEFIRWAVRKRRFSPPNLHTGSRVHLQSCQFPRVNTGKTVHRERAESKWLKKKKTRFNWTTFLFDSLFISFITIC